MNKTGTTSFHQLIKASGYNSIHWGFTAESRSIGKRLVSNHTAGLPILNGMDEFECYTDLGFCGGGVYIEGAKFFPELAAAYPDAYFVFNTRPKIDWMASRLDHFFVVKKFFGLIQTKTFFLNRCSDALQLSKNDTISMWGELYVQHHRDVREFFADGEFKFLEFDITKHDPQMIADFLAPDYKINTEHWGKRNTRQSRNKNKLLYRLFRI